MTSTTRASVMAAIVSLVALVFIGALLIRNYIVEERQRDLQQWESRLGLVADARVDAVSRLLVASRREIGELAANASLRFYVWQAVQRGGDAGSGEPGAVGYLRNLLLVAAQRYGYADEARVPANLPQPRSAGLVILGTDLAPLVATPGLVDPGVNFGDIARRALDDPRGAVTGLVRDAQDRPVLVTAAAIAPVPGAGGAGGGEPIGVVLGVRDAAQDLYPLLTRGPSFSEDSEALLIEKRGDAIALLSPTRDGSPGLRRTLPADRADLAEAAAVSAPGRLVALANYRGDRVLQVSRPVRGQGWMLVQQVDADQALSLADDRRRFLLAALSLLLFSIAAVAVAAWRHGSSVRSRHQAEELADKAARLQRQTDLLHAITDSLDVATLLVTSDGRVKFLNRAAADAAGSSIARLLDDKLAGVLPPPVLAEVEAGIGEARGRGSAAHRTLRWPLDGAAREYRAGFIPVERIGEERDLTLVVLTDLTDLQHAQRRHADLLRRLVLTLVSAVDRHDPYSVDHARRMTLIAEALAAELGFSDPERSSIALAASLANIGKIMIPVEVLTKTDALTDDERRLLEKHVEYGLELLRGLEFETPVAELIAQKQERPDGRGYPRGLAGERITMGGQIIAVANAFVALTSDRSYRRGLRVEAALDELMRVAGAQFDRRVIAALFHVAENRAKDV